MIIDWAFSLSGFFVGVVVGLTGVGGGALMTPMLVLLLGIAPSVAVGTDLWFAAATKAVGSLFHHQKSNVDWQVVRRLCLGSIPASILTLFILHTMGPERSQDGVILEVLGVVMVLTAVAMLCKERLHKWGTGFRVSSPSCFKSIQPIATVLAGAVIGTLVSLTSIGAGALGAVLLLYLYPLRMTSTRLVGTDLMHAVPLTVVAGYGHMKLGNVDFTLLGPLLLGSIPGVIVGSQMTARVPETLLRSSIAVVLVGIGVTLIK